MGNWKSGEAISSDIWVCPKIGYPQWEFHGGKLGIMLIIHWTLKNPPGVVGQRMTCDDFATALKHKAQSSDSPWP